MQAKMTSFTYIRIPFSNDQELQLISVPVLTECIDDPEAAEVAAAFGSETSVKLTVLLRPTVERVPGLYAYSTNHNRPNIRATRLAIACGHLALRFCGDVLVFRHFRTSLLISDIFGAACVSPDLRESILRELADGRIVHIPTWLAQATQQNYHDVSALQEFAQSMVEKNEDQTMLSTVNSFVTEGDVTRGVKDLDESSHDPEDHSVVAKTPLCLECRRPCEALCPGCEGCYFCLPPRLCRSKCWSHDCFCATWKVYTARRSRLKEFPFDGWHFPLLTRDNELSEEPFRKFLEGNLGISCEKASWWRTETDGWAAGKSFSAKMVDPCIRRSMKEGFDPVVDVPPPRRPSSTERTGFRDNKFGLIELSSWEDYYRLRNIPLSSPVAILLSFPLTVYYAISMFGQVPVTVARMLKRPVRLHLVGVEKELNFLDIFQELGYLLPIDLEVEIVFVVRKDMLPQQAKKRKLERTQLTDNLSICVVAGTYGTDDLDPNFDCGSGAPDIIVALNAGLFAYESWRSVVEYLYYHKGVVGVFTDYNEHSGTFCAALGGASDLHVNPFRQPRAMPVYSMNLPQFSNGFVYVYNDQELEL